jgi:hypothetical protein
LSSFKKVFTSSKSGKVIKGSGTNILLYGHRVCLYIMDLRLVGAPVLPRLISSSFRCKSSSDILTYCYILWLDRCTGCIRCIYCLLPSITTTLTGTHSKICCVTCRTYPHFSFPYGSTVILSPPSCPFGHLSQSPIPAAG